MPRAGPQDLLVALAFNVKGAVAAELRDECSQAGASFVTIETTETER